MTDLVSNQLRNIYKGMTQALTSRPIRTYTLTTSNPDGSDVSHVRISGDNVTLDLRRGIVYARTATDRLNVFTVEEVIFPRPCFVSLVEIDAAKRVRFEPPKTATVALELHRLRARNAWLAKALKRVRAKATEYYRRAKLAEAEALNLRVEKGREAADKQAELHERIRNTLLGTTSALIAPGVSFMKDAIQEREAKSQLESMKVSADGLREARKLAELEAAVCARRAETYLAQASAPPKPVPGHGWNVLKSSGAGDVWKPSLHMGGCIVPDEKTALELVEAFQKLSGRWTYEAQPFCFDTTGTQWTLQLICAKGAIAMLPCPALLEYCREHPDKHRIGNVDFETACNLAELSRRTHPEFFTVIREVK